MVRVLLFSLFLVVPGCKKSQEHSGERANSATAASRDVPAATELGDVVATLQMPSATPPQLGTFVDAFQPGASVMVGTQLPVMLGKIAGIDLGGADLASPVSLVVVNPTRYPEPVALVVKTSDTKKLKEKANAAQRGFAVQSDIAVLGAPETVKAASEFAFAYLIASSEQVVGTVYPTPILKAYESKLDAAMDEMGAAMAVTGQGAPFVEKLTQFYKTLIVGLGEQTQRVVVTLDAVDGASDLRLSFHPQPNTPLASFVKAQVKADHDLLAKLPGKSETAMLFSGELRAGKARQALVDLGMHMVSFSFGEAADIDRELFTSWLEHVDGSVAGTMEMDFESSGSVPNFAVAYLWGTTDAEAMRDSMRKMVKAFSDRNGTAAFGMKFSIEVKENEFQVGGVSVDSSKTIYEMNTVPAGQRGTVEKLTNQKTYWTAVPSIGAMAMGPNGEAAIKSLVSALKKGTQSPPLREDFAKVVARSKAQDESFIVVLNMGAMLKKQGIPLPFELLTFAMGRQDEALNLRISASK